MTRHLIAPALLAIALAAPATAQQATGALAPQTRTMVTPVAPPGIATVQVAPGTWVVTPVPGIATATQVRFQRFSDYDLDRDGALGRMEFAQAAYFMATSDPVAGNPKLPMSDKYMHRGAAQPMAPERAAELVNATSDEFAAVDANHDGRVTPAELGIAG